jgi:ankyrin repeat protein
MRVAPVLLLSLTMVACDRSEPEAPPDHPAIAAAEGRLGDLLRQLDAGASPNDPSTRGALPLVEAVRAGHDTVVMELLAAGANPLLLDGDGINAWDAVMRSGHTGVADRLILHAARESGAGPSVLGWFAGVRGEVPNPPRWQEVLSGALLPIGLMYAAHHDRADLIATMRRGREIPNPTGYHALAVAARWGRLDAVRALLAIDVHPDLESARRTTALMEASRDGHQAVAAALFAAGADPNHADARGETVLHWARRLDQPGYGVIARRAGADPGRRNVAGLTAEEIMAGDAPIP